MIFEVRQAWMLFGLEWPVALSVVEMAVRTTVVVGAALLLGVALRRRSAALRRLLWVGTLAIVTWVGIAGAVAAVGAASGPAVQWTPQIPGAPFDLVAARTLWIWLVPTAFLLLRLAWMQHRLRRLLAQCATLDGGPWHREAAAIGRRLGLRRPVPLRVSRRLTAPVTVGVVVPCVLIPASLLHAQRDLRRSVLWHELAHVRRRDVAGRWVAALACAVQWFHPLVWLAARRLRRECELASDDAVLAAGRVAGATYARHLLALADAAVPQATPLVSLGIGASELRRRIEAIAAPRDRREHGAAARWALAALGIALALAVTRVELPRPRAMTFLPAEGAETHALPTFVNRSG